MLASPSKLLITTTADENILWDLHTNTIQALLTTILSSIRLSNQQLAVGTNEGEIQLWKFTEEDETNHSISFLNHTITKRIFLPSPFKVQNLLQLSDGRLLTHIAAEGKLYFWNLETLGVKEEITSIPVQCFSSIPRIIEYQHPDSAFSLSSIISTPTTAKPEDYLTIIFPNGNNIHIWTIAKSNCENPIQPTKKALQGHRLAVNQVAQLKSGRILSASWDQTIRIWNIFDGKTDCERIYSMDVLGDLSIDLLPDRKGFLVKSRSDIDIFRPFDDE
jgi:WD40 repeat protein